MKNQRKKFEKFKLAYRHKLVIIINHNLIWLIEFWLIENGSLKMDQWKWIENGSNLRPVAVVAARWHCRLEGASRCSVKSADQRSSPDVVTVEQFEALVSVLSLSLGARDR